MAEKGEVLGVEGVPPAVAAESCEFDEAVEGAVGGEHGGHGFAEAFFAAEETRGGAVERQGEGAEGGLLGRVEHGPALCIAAVNDAMLAGVAAGIAKEMFDGAAAGAVDAMAEGDVQGGAGANGG